MNRDHAVQRIREAGFDAFAHDSWMGECVGCGRVTQESDGVKQYAILIYLFPTKGGWGVQAPSVLAMTDFSQKLTLDDATKLAIGILRSPFLPYSSDDVVLTVARCIGGDGRWIEHKPTGIQRTLFIPVDGKKKEFMNEEQALQEILFEIATLGSNPSGPAQACERSSISHAKNLEQNSLIPSLTS